MIKTILYVQYNYYNTASSVHVWGFQIYQLHVWKQYFENRKNKNGKISISLISRTSKTSMAIVKISNKYKLYKITKIWKIKIIKNYIKVMRNKRVQEENMPGICVQYVCSMYKWSTCINCQLHLTFYPTLKCLGFWLKLNYELKLRLLTETKTLKLEALLINI